MNNLDKVVPVNLGLGGEIREEAMDVDPKFSVGARFSDNGNINSEKVTLFPWQAIAPVNDSVNIKSKKVGITTIDAYVEENNITVGLIKTDVEGFEQELLRGALNTIKRDKPVLMISIYHTFDDFWDIKPLIESWNLGYTFTIKKPDTLDFCGDLVLNAEVPR